MEAPTLQMVIVDGQPVYEVRLGLSVFRHRDRWQAEVVAHQWAHQSNAQISQLAHQCQRDSGHLGHHGVS